MGLDGMERDQGKEKSEEDSPKKEQLNRRQMLGLGLGGAAFLAANAAMHATVGVDTQRQYEAQQEVDKKNTSIRKASVLGKGIDGGNGSATEGFVSGATAGSIMGPGAAVMFGAGGAVQGASNSQKKYWVNFKVDGINDAQASLVHYISKEQYEKWSVGDQIEVKVVTEADDSEKLRSVSIENR